MMDFGGKLDLKQEHGLEGGPVEIRQVFGLELHPLLPHEPR